MSDDIDHDDTVFTEMRGAEEATMCLLCTAVIP